VRLFLYISAVFLVARLSLGSEPFDQSSNFTVNTSFSQIDSDSDGLPDSYEQLIGTNPLVADSDQDPDMDGQSTLQEYNAGTDPFQLNPLLVAARQSSSFLLNTKSVVPDSNGNGLPDWWENLYGLTGSSADPNSDPDADGASNSTEFQQGTNPNEVENGMLSSSVSSPFVVLTRTFQDSFRVDTDGDGLPDWWELKYKLNPKVIDSDSDVDADGVSALSEFLAGRDPNIDDLVRETASLSSIFALNTSTPRLDTDNDSLPDWWELRYGLNEKLPNGLEDLDGDGATNFEEYARGTNPTQPDNFSLMSSSSAYFRVDTGGMQISYWQDSDLDGMPDWWELRYALNIHLNDSGDNPDHDLYTNFQEFSFGSRPNLYDSQRPEDTASALFVVNTGGSLIDSDRDGLPDAWETFHFGSLEMSPNNDSDGDGLTNLDEYLAGTNPTDSSSSLKGFIGNSANGIQISWSTIPGKTYRLLSVQSLPATQSEAVIEFTATESVATYLITLNAAATFFYVQVLP
jgi:hypothetical protein